MHSCAEESALRVLLSFSYQGLNSLAMKITHPSLSFLRVGHKGFHLELGQDTQIPLT